MARTSAGLLSELRAGLLPPDTCRAICSGVLPLPALERAELLCIIGSGNPHSLAASAEAALAFIAPETFLLALKWEDAAPELIAWCATHLGRQPGIAESLAMHPGCP